MVDIERERRGALVVFLVVFAEEFLGFVVEDFFAEVFVLGTGSIADVFWGLLLVFLVVGSLLGSFVGEDGVMVAAGVVI